MARLNIDEGAERVSNLLRAMTLEMQMLARACGKSDVHHLEPEDMAALSMEASGHLRHTSGRDEEGVRKIMSFLLRCPHCGNRSVYEFRFGGEIKERPAADASEDDWLNYTL